MTAPILALALLAAQAQPHQPESGSHPDPVERVYVRLSPAESLQVTSAGEGAPVVLIPSLFGSAFGYRHLLVLLPAAGYRAIVIEPLGIGTSARPEKGDYTLTRQADRIATVIRQVLPGPAIVVAHSSGASMALRLAYRHPTLVTGVVSLDGGPAESATSPGFRRAMQYVPWIKWLGGVRRVRSKIKDNFIATSGDPSWVTDAVVDGYTAGAKADLDGTLKAYLRMAESREPERLVPRLGAVKCPVRLVVGTAPHDGGIPARQLAALRRELPNFAMDSVPGAGLHLYEEQPDSVVAAVRRVSRDAMVEPCGSS